MSTRSRLSALFLGLLLTQSAYADGVINPGGGSGGGGSGTVTSIATGCQATGGTITTTGTISTAEVPTILSGTNVPIIAGYCGGLEDLSNASSQTPTIAEAGTTGFPTGWFTDICNIGAGTQTLTPTAGTIGGAASRALGGASAVSPNCLRIISDGVSDYKVAFITPTSASIVTPTHQAFLTGSGTYTTPANVKWLEITLVGPGGGGAGSDNTGSPTGGAAGSAASCWNTSGAACTTPVYSAGPGGGGKTFGAGVGGAGGTISGSGTCDQAFAGGAGQGSPLGAFNVTTGFTAGAVGGSNPLGGAGTGVSNAAGTNGVANSGAGGGGGGTTANAAATQDMGGAGGAGAYCHVIISAPAGTYTYSIGSGGAGGVGGTNGFGGGNGAAGWLFVYEHYGD